jgi:S1-C subfamily serine protease
MPRYDDEDFDRPRRRSAATPSGGTSLLPWALVGVLAVALLAAGVGLFVAWPKGGSAKTTDPDALPRNVTPKGAPDAEETEAVNLFKNAKDSVVNVDTVVLRRNLQTRSTDVIQAGTGSGFVWDDEGRIVTNYHVIREAIKNKLTLRVVLADRSEWKVTVVGTAPEYDLAVLKINAPPGQLKKIKVGTSRDLEVGQKVYAIGNPFGLSLTLTKGIVSALDREMDSPANTPITGVIQTDAPINPGNSGGPLLDKDGRLIGVNTAIATAKEGGGSVGIGFAVPVDTVNRVVPQLIQGGKVQKSDMGVKLVDQVRLRRAGYDRGVMIEELEPGGPASQAGLRALSIDPRTRDVTPGDLIIKVDGVDVKGNADFEQMMNRHKPGERVKLTVERDGKTLEADVILRGV